MSVINYALRQTRQQPFYVHLFTLDAKK